MVGGALRCNQSAYIKPDSIVPLYNVSVCVHESRTGRLSHAEQAHTITDVGDVGSMIVIVIVSVGVGKHGSSGGICGSCGVHKGKREQ